MWRRLKWVKIWKWSDTVLRYCDIVGERFVREEVITRSSVWLCMWVETETCWVRLVDDNRRVNCWEEESRGSSTWILKSPVIMNSCGVVVAEDKKFENHLEDTDGLRAFGWCRWAIDVKKGESRGRQFKCDRWTFKSFVVMRWVKDYRNRVKDEERSTTAQGFVRDVIFLVRG